MSPPLQSIAKVCYVELVRGAEADPSAEPDLLLEVPHGATLASHFESLRTELQGDYDDGLRDFFFVNTDVGAPELALAIARGVVARRPHSTAMVVRCLLPRTFVDCNRVLDRDTAAAGSEPGEMTSGLPPWVLHGADRELLLNRYFAYRELVDAAFLMVCGENRSAESGIGRALCVHTYAPRSLDIAVDEDISTALHAAYQPDRITSWPLRAEVDLITHDPDGRQLADDELAGRAMHEFADGGFQVVRNETYSLHPATVAYELAQRYPNKTLCFEVRRDLLLDEFVPFVELHTSDAKVALVAQPLIVALG
jgi:predicted N-formylglutamate amidohydrolase